METNLLLWVVCFLYVTTTGGTTPIACKEPTQCADWKLYKDEKCFKIVEKAGIQSQEDAEIVCSAFSEELTVEALPRLITIKTQEEQEFIYHVLFKQEKLLDNVWLGMRKEENSSVYKWNDGSEVMFSNWVELNMTEGDRECVQMESGREVFPAGKWVKVQCQRRAIVVCERLQTLTQAMIRTMFLNNRLEQKTKEEQWNQKFSILEKRFEKEIENLKQHHSSNYTESADCRAAGLLRYCQNGSCVCIECTMHHQCFQCAAMGKRGHCSNDYKCSCLDCIDSSGCADCPPGKFAQCQDGSCSCVDCLNKDQCADCPPGMQGRCKDGTCSCVDCIHHRHCKYCPSGTHGWCNSDETCSCEVDCLKHGQCADCPPGMHARCKAGTCSCVDCLKHDQCADCLPGMHGRCKDWTCSCVG